MRLMVIESYPNREIRIGTVRAQVAKRFAYDSDLPAGEKKDATAPPTCHSLKTRNASNKPQLSGLLDIEGTPGYGGLPRIQRFSLYARRQILRSGGALERMAPHRDCLFLTVTLPGSTQKAMEALSRFSAFAVHRLKAWVAKRIPCKYDLYTWEWQKRGALHLHYVVHCPDRDAGEYIRKNLKQQWIRILDAIGLASGVDMYQKSSGFTWASNKEITRVDAQWCEKSVAAYLSKYVSKANKFQYTQRKQNYCPSRWYGVSRPLLAKLRELSFRVSLDSLRDRDAWESYEDCLSVLQAFAIKCYEYKHEVGDGKTVVAYVHQQEQQSIWNTIMTQTVNTPDSSQNIEERLRKCCQQGIYTMKRSRLWLNTFKQFCANSRPAHLISSPLSQDITPSDLCYVMDMLMYTFRYVERTRYDLDGSSKLWYKKAILLLEIAESEGVSWAKSLLPCKD